MHARAYTPVRPPVTVNEQGMGYVPGILFMHENRYAADRNTINVNEPGARRYGAWREFYSGEMRATSTR